MTIPLNILVYERGDAGVPSSNLIDDLRARANSYTHTITDQFGFESMQLALTVSLDEAIEWLQNGLMRSVVVCGPDAETVWEGVLTTISAQVGQKPATLSLDAMANRVRCVYTTVLSSPGVYPSAILDGIVGLSNTTSQFLYGIKDRVVSLSESDRSAAGYRAAIVLADAAFPKSREATQAVTGAQGDITLTLSFTGWYGTLEWPVTSVTTTSTAVTTTQVGALLTNAAAVNAFVSTSTLRITASGISSPQFIAAQTTYREAIEERLKLGTGTYPLAWGVYENREFYVQAWAGATPSTITYQEVLGDANVYDAAGGVVPPWLVRPNAISQVNDLLDVGPPSAAPDAAARKYVGRVTCTISGDQVGVTLEPSELDSIETRLSALR
jgi:hypothetical protein